MLELLYKIVLHSGFGMIVGRLVEYVLCSKRIHQIAKFVDK